MTKSPLFLIIDTETTGQDPQQDRVCEFGCCATTLHDLVDTAQGFLVDPGVLISPEASAVHHLLDQDVAGKPTLASVLSSLADWPVWRDVDAYVAHNAPFDKSFLPQLADKPWLDTLRMTRRYYPDFPSHSNQALRYRLKLPVPRHLDVHRAASDCIVTAALLRHTLAGPAAEDFQRLGVAGFIEYVDSPLVLDTVNFGKHAGRKWAEVPHDYLYWILRQPDFDPDVAFTARHYLHR